MEPNFIRQNAPTSLRNATRTAAGLLAGSLIMTLDGERPVSTLRPGDRIITRDAGSAKLRAVRKRRVDVPTVRIKASSLGHNRPEHDTTLPAGQTILVRDWRARAIFGLAQVLVPAARLTDGEFVTLQETATMTIYELEFDTPHVLYVDGLEVASYMPKATAPKPG